MRIAYITAGAAGMLCGSCLHDNTLAAALGRRGHDVALIPTYTPVRTDEDDVSIDRVFYGAVNVYLEQRWRWYRHAPAPLHWLLDRPFLLRWVSRLAGSAATQGDELGALSLSVLRGEDGRQRGELERLVAWLRDEFKPDLVHITNSMLLGLARTMKREIGGVPVLCNVQGEDIFIDEMIEPWRSRVLDELHSHARDVDAFVATSNYYAAHMAAYLGVSTDRMRVIRLGVTLDGHRPASPGSTDTFTIGFLARLCPEKGVHELIEAVGDIAARGGAEGLRLRVAGYSGARDAAYVAEQRRRIEALGLGSRVDWLGEVDRAAKMDFLAGLDLLALPTVYAESKGLPALEAMASGVPVLLPAHGSFPEMIEWTGGGLLHEPGSRSALVEGLETLRDDPSRRAALGAAGREAVHRELSDEAMAAATLREYERWVCTS